MTGEKITVVERLWAIDRHGNRTEVRTADELIRECLLGGAVRWERTREELSRRTVVESFAGVARVVGTRQDDHRR